MNLSLHVLVFLAVGIVFLALPLIVGWWLRPNTPNQDKLAAYECGEEPIGSSDVQFDLRFYVVALLFIVFDVELAFLFPWGAVYGTLVQLADHQLSDGARSVLSTRLAGSTPDVGISAHEAFLCAALVLAEFLVFFGILLVGFAYLWRRGDLEWVRALVNTRTQAARAERQS